MTIQALEELYARLDPRPLETSEEIERYYVERTGDQEDVEPLGKLKRRLLLADETARFFLSGHVGSGKSTELARLASDPAILRRFTVVRFRFEEGEAPHLDSRQVLFRVAAELFARGSGMRALESRRSWAPVLGQLDGVLHGAKGAQVKEVSTSAEINLFFGKVRSELKLSEGQRKRFREFGETEVTLLRDLVDKIADDLRAGLAAAGEPARLLVVIDDLDKVREPEAQRELFDTGLSTLFAPRCAMVLTLPGAVTFGGIRPQLRDATDHVRPIQVLATRSSEQSPEEAAHAAGIAWMVQLARTRVPVAQAPDEALAVAALYSGGVARDMFHILREAALNALMRDLPAISKAHVDRAVHDHRVKLQYGIYPADWELLRSIRGGHQLPSMDAAALLDRSVVLEYNHDDLWFDVTPALWPLLEKAG